MDQERGRCRKDRITSPPPRLILQPLSIDSIHSYGDHLAFIHHLTGTTAPAAAGLCE